MLQLEFAHVSVFACGVLHNNENSPATVHAAVLAAPDRQMYETILALTPASAGKQWVSFTSDTMQLLLLHDLDPTLAAPLLTAHMVHVTAWLLCLYYFNTQGEGGALLWSCRGLIGWQWRGWPLLLVLRAAPGLTITNLFHVLSVLTNTRVHGSSAAAAVALALHNVNLLTRQKETPPPGHYATALQAAGISTQQLRQIAIANRFVAPRLHKLQQEQEHLVQQMAELQQRLGPGEAALVGGLVAAAGGGAQLPDSAADGPHAAACGGDVRQLASPPTLGALGVGVMPSTAAEVKADPDDAAVAATVVSSVATDAATTAGSSHVGGGGSGSSTTGGDSSNRLRQQQLAKANELMQKMSANHRAWVVVASMRGHYSTSVLHPIQFAKLVTASAPYLLFGAPM